MSAPSVPYLAKLFRLAVGFAGLTAWVIQAPADTIYHDDFNDQQNIATGGPYTQTLAGSIPTIRSGTRGGSANATWLAGVEAGGWGQRDYGDNGVATPTSSNFLPFTPDAGLIYTVQATIDTTPLGGADPGGSSSWFTLGFTSSQHHWNGVDASTIDVGHLVRWNSNAVTTITYTVSGADLVAAGIQYVGWITDRAGTVNLNGSTQVKVDNFRLTSGVANPTVTYDGNGSDGGTVPTDGASPYTFGATVTTLGTGTMTRVGYSHLSWNTAADGSGTSYNPGETFRITNHTTLYARWLAVGSYTLTYHGNGHTSGIAPVDGGSPYNGGATVTVQGNVGSLGRASHRFSGWNTAADGSGTNLSPEDTFSINSNTTLYARWTPGPDYLWDNSAATDNWSATDSNWSGAVWTNAASSNAFFTGVGGAVFPDSGIVAGAVNVGQTSANFPNLGFYEGSLSAASLTVQGSSGNPGNYGANPTLSVDSSATISGDAAVGRANLNIIGGTFTANRIISAPGSADWGRLVVYDGTVTATNGVDGSVNTGATFAIDLNGGTLEAPSIRVADREAGTNNNAWMTFNGGVLKAIGADHPDFITTYGGGRNAYVSSGGAIIDTNGFNIGIQVNLLDAGGGGLIKQGAGTLTLGGANTYIGDTTINAGTVVLADNARLKFAVTETPTSNMVAGTGAATFHGDFVIDTSSVTGNTGYIWTLVNRATLTGESFDPVTFSVVGFADPEDDGVWTMTDSRGDWSFSEATGELTLDIGSDYEDWAASYGLAIGSEAGDLDNDGLANFAEYAFGLAPDSGSSTNPIVVPLDKLTGKFRYTRRATPAATGLNYAVWTSTDLVNWTEDVGATSSQVVTGTVGSIETVEASVTGTPPLAQPKLFIQVRVN